MTQTLAPANAAAAILAAAAELASRRILAWLLPVRPPRHRERRTKQSKINNSGLLPACRRLPSWYGRFVGFWPDGVVPVRVVVVAVDRQGFHLLVGVDEASGVFTGVQLDGQPGGCGGG